jgi:hypothetical protein
MRFKDNAADTAVRFYREEGERLRIAADATTEADVRADLLTLADRYDQLAEQSRQELGADTPVSEPPRDKDAGR